MYRVNIVFIRFWLPVYKCNSEIRQIFCASKIRFLCFFPCLAYMFRDKVMMHNGFTHTFQLLLRSTTKPAPPQQQQQQR